ncbi:GyrI-like domain-containing protein [Aquimarina hainanensis]|uniref:GyrI-like domain-containing protein n=1 Tax=Aquimarina hainanensis TaxID=1578017 RepID=A0ABW5N516_9FLAO
MATDKEIQQADYINRINRVFEFIDQNLDTTLSLTIVSEIASFSPFHFHRIFKMLTNETLHQYISRRRIEKAALDLLHKNVKTTVIAHQYGFSDNTSFSRAFKKYFGMSPMEFKKQNPNKHSKIRQLESKNGQEYPSSKKYICIIENLKNWITMKAVITIKTIPDMEVAYISSIGAQNLSLAYQKLIRWATPKGLINEQTKMLTVYFDSFKVTASHKVRMHASILLTTPAETSGEIGKTTVEAGKCIVGHFEITPEEFEKSWTGLFLWMNENGYKKSDRNPFEIYHNDFTKHPENKCIVDFCIPIM